MIFKSLSVRTSSFWLFIVHTHTVCRSQVWRQPEHAMGARSLALGQSALITASDALSASWNPASIGTVQNVIASVFYTELSKDKHNTSYGIVIPTNNFGSFGISYFHLSFGNYSSTDKLGEATGTFSETRRHLLMTYSKDFIKSLIIGFNAKLVYHTLAEFKSSPQNIGIDIGFQYFFQRTDSMPNNFAVGIAIDNLVRPTIKFIQEPQFLPREFRLIAEKELPLFRGHITVINNFAFYETIGYDRKHKSRYHLGAEYCYKIIGLRAGFRGESITFGTGLKLSSFIFNYVYNTAEYSHDFYVGHHGVSIDLKL